MKNLALTFLTFLLLAGNTFAQKSVFDIVNNSSKVVFMGIDFRNAKFIGTSGFTDPSKIQNVYLHEWNSIYLKEYEKYSLVDFLKITPENYAVSVANMIELNKSFDVKANITNEMVYELSEDKLQGIVNDYKIDANEGIGDDYKIDANEGIGVAYIVETFNSLEDKSTIYAVFYDLSNNSIFFKQKVITEPGGFGFKNFWARSYFYVQAEYFPKWYKQWKKEAKKKK